MVAISPLLVSAQQERWVLRGQKAMQAQDYPKAIEYFEWATKKEGNLQAYEGLGNCYWEIKAYNQSVKNYRLATEYAACT
ncbi:MAG TPA: hypothetical protein ENJ82_06740, partial [Bacteroidetes bacterium]|nr:hypothetical protein [Bacteroidota bacterium]